MKLRTFTQAVRLVSVALMALVCSSTMLAAAKGKSTTSTSEKERELIAVLRSKAPPEEKAITCKRLAIYGTEQAVPALAPLLLDKDLASWARIALEAIPGPTSDAALRGAIPKLQGRLLVGTINSIGVRRDTNAVTPLIRKLKDTDVQVASASAISLGKIGGQKAANALENSLTERSPELRAAVAEGCILCAEQFFSAGNSIRAVALYDKVRSAEVPKHKAMEATRGAILARRTEGLPLLLECLRSSDKDQVAIALHTARELPGRDVTDALAAEMSRFEPQRQAALLLAIADRADASVLPIVLEAARTGSKEVRLAAIGVLDRLGKSSSAPVLLEAASSDDPQLSKAALAALARLPGNQVDQIVLERLQAQGRTRKVLIEVTAQRRIEPALPAILASVEDADPAVRRASLQTLGELGQEQHAATLVKLLQKTKDAKERDDLETALVALAGRHGKKCSQHLATLSRSDDPELRIIGLHALASAGGSEALDLVKVALEDKESTVQDEAVRTLSAWPGNWPEDERVAEPLLNLARSSGKTSHQVLALRGYFEFLRADKKLKDQEKIAKVTDLLPLLKRPEEKRLAVATLDGIASPAVLDLFVTFATEADLAEEASSALMKLAEKRTAGLSKELRQKALHTVIDNSKNDGTKKKAQEMLKGI